MRLLLGFVLSALLMGNANAQPSLAQPVVPGSQIVSGTNTLFLPSVPNKSALNITTGTNLKTGAGMVTSVCLNTASSGGASSIIDSAGVSVTAANTIFAIPQAQTAPYCATFQIPFATGLSVVPGTSAVLTVSYQ
jgi:hypothetical protein